MLRDVSLTLYPGEIHALMGENGRQVNVDEHFNWVTCQRCRGTILIDGKETNYADPKEAEQAGVSFIHQEMNNWEQMTVLDNLFLNRELKTTFGLLDTKKMASKAQAVFEQLGIHLPKRSG